ncbi:MAG: hypothetical protein ACE1ZM_08035 [Gammaproteobacteria bacterium]
MPVLQDDSREGGGSERQEHVLEQKPVMPRNATMAAIAESTTYPFILSNRVPSYELDSYL